MDHTQHDPGGEQRGKLSRARRVFIAFTVLAAYFPITESQAHLSGPLYYLPYLLLLAWLAVVEKREMLKQSGDEYARCAAHTPWFFPRLGAAGANRSESAYARSQGQPCN